MTLDDIQDWLKELDEQIYPMYLRDPDRSRDIEFMRELRGVRDALMDMRNRRLADAGRALSS